LVAHQQVASALRAELVRHVVDFKEFNRVALAVKYIAAQGGVGTIMVRNRYEVATA